VGKKNKKHGPFLFGGAREIGLKTQSKKTSQDALVGKLAYKWMCGETNWFQQSLFKFHVKK